MEHSNFFNFLLAVLVPFPSVLLYLCFLYADDISYSSNSWRSFCIWGRENPFLFLNVLFFFNVDVLFWIIGLIQRNVWLIDPYWTIIPVLIAHFYSLHPSGKSDPFRSRAGLLLIWVWSARLTYNYFRREQWQWGKREDWRFTDIRRENPKSWWWKSFFVCFVSQHIFLVGITLPLYSIFTQDVAWNAWDAIAFVLCLSGILTAHFADAQLHSFVTRSNELKELGVPRKSVLNHGLWFYSRHPNYFGEQLFWWGLSLFSAHLGQPWAVAGTVVNSGCLAYTTVLVERRMLRDTSRAKLYREYQKSTSVLIPWFKKSSGMNRKAS